MEKKDTDGPWLSALESIELMGCRGFNRDSWGDHFVCWLRVSNHGSRDASKNTPRIRERQCVRGNTTGVTGCQMGCLILFCS